MLVILLLAVVGWRFKETRAHLSTCLIIVIVLLINYLVLSLTLDFGFLIDYERGNYATRLLPLSIFFLAPYLVLGMGGLVERLKKTPIFVQLGSAALVAGIITSAFYLTYPRDDAYVRDRGFNVSYFYI